MSQQDRQRWNRKYAAGNPNAAFEPDPLLVQYAHLLTGHGLALDLACGVGHNAMHLARRGYEVIAVDASLVGLDYCQSRLQDSRLRVHLVAADLDDFVLPRNLFALVVVFRFLSRSLLPGIKQALAPGGLLIMQTFNVNQLRVAPQMNPEYLLQPEELAQTFASLETIATNDTADNLGELTYWIGRRP